MRLSRNRPSAVLSAYDRRRRATVRNSWKKTGPGNIGGSRDLEGKRGIPARCRIVAASPWSIDMRRHPSLLATEFHDRSSAWPVQALLFDRLAPTPDRAAR